MENTQRRVLMFLFGCMPARLGIAYLASKASLRQLRWMATVALIVAISFTIIYVGGFRRTGLETGGDLIWWNKLRPLHALMFLTFVMYAWAGHGDVAWKILVADACLGLLSFLVYHHGGICPVNSVV